MLWCWEWAQGKELGGTIIAPWGVTPSIMAPIHVVGALANIGETGVIRPYIQHLSTDHLCGHFLAHITHIRGAMLLLPLPLTRKERGRHHSEKIERPSTLGPTAFQNSVENFNEFSWAKLTTAGKQNLMDRENGLENRSLGAYFIHYNKKKVKYGKC